MDITGINTPSCYMDMSKFVLKMTSDDWEENDRQESAKRWRVMEAEKAMIEETGDDIKKRELINKRASQNERQKRSRAKKTQKEIKAGIRDEGGKMKPKAKVRGCRCTSHCYHY